MKKILTFVIIAVAVSLLAFAKPVKSQSEVSSEYRTALSQYQKVYAEYSLAREDYILKRSQYLSFKTLKSQTDAYDATSKFLRIRDDVYLSYMQVLTIRLNEAVGISQDKKAALQLRVDQETLWYSSHRNSIPSAGTLEDLVKDSEIAEKHTQISHLFFYELLVYVADGQVTDFNGRTKNFLQEIKKLVEVIKVDESDEAFSNEKISLIDRWIFDSESRIVRSEQKQVEGLAQIVDLNKKTGDNQSSEYNDVIQVFSEAAIFLKEANAFMGEVIAEIKRAD